MGTNVGWVNGQSVNIEHLRATLNKNNSVFRLSPTNIDSICRNPDLIQSIMGPHCAAILEAHLNPFEITVLESNKKVDAVRDRVIRVPQDECRPYDIMASYESDYLNEYYRDEIVRCPVNEENEIPRQTTQEADFEELTPRASLRAIRIPPSFINEAAESPRGSAGSSPASVSSLALKTERNNAPERRHIRQSSTADVESLS